MASKKISTKRTSHSPLICLVCGDIARGMNFNVVTCMSCKAFFRRHASQKSKELHCQLNNDCIITQHTRGGCSACRLKKCFSLGMNPDLIRSSPQKLPASTDQQNIKIDEQQHTNLPQPTTISLLSNDRSILTFNEWNILSNIVHAYDEQNIVIRTQCFLQEQSSLPLKVRSKKSNTLDFIGSFYTAMQPFLERSPYLPNLSSDVRRVLIQNNLNGTGAFNSIFAALEAKVFDNEHHILTCNEIYGADYVQECGRLMAQLEPNGTLIKMLLIILAFSSNCSLVLPEHTFPLMYTSVTSSIVLIQVQDVLVVILWKYLVYQYGFIEAVRRLDGLVKNYLDLLNRINENNSKEHFQMVDIIVERTVHALTLDS